MVKMNGFAAIDSVRPFRFWIDKAAVAADFHLGNGTCYLGICRIASTASVCTLAEKRCLPYRSDLLISKHIRCGHTPEKWRSGLSAEASFFYFGSVPNPLFLKATIILTEVHLLFFANYQHPFLIKKDVIVFKIWRKAGFIITGYICPHTLSDFFTN